jgi:hypothetical protein
MKRENGTKEREDDVRRATSLTACAYFIIIIGAMRTRDDGIQDDGRRCGYVDEEVILNAYNMW